MGRDLRSAVRTQSLIDRLSSYVFHRGSVWASTLTAERLRWSVNCQSAAPG